MFLVFLSVCSMIILFHCRLCFFGYNTLFRILFCIFYCFRVVDFIFFANFRGALATQPASRTFLLVAQHAQKLVGPLVDPRLIPFGTSKGKRVKNLRRLQLE